MDIILLAKILSALEWQNFNTHNDSISDHIRTSYLDILKETQLEFDRLTQESNYEY